MLKRKFQFYVLLQWQALLKCIKLFSFLHVVIITFLEDLGLLNVFSPQNGLFFLHLYFLGWSYCQKYKRFLVHCVLYVELRFKVQCLYMELCLISIQCGSIMLFHNKAYIIFGWRSCQSIDVPKLMTHFKVVIYLVVLQVCSEPKYTRGIVLYIYFYIIMNSLVQNCLFIFSFEVGATFGYLHYVSFRVQDNGKTLKSPCRNLGQQVSYWQLMYIREDQTIFFQVTLPPP